LASKIAGVHGEGVERQKNARKKEKPHLSTGPSSLSLSLYLPPHLFYAG